MNAALIALAIVTLADIVSTIISLRRMPTEADAIMARLQRFGHLSWVAKAAFTAWWLYDAGRFGGPGVGGRAGAVGDEQRKADQAKPVRWRAQSTTRHSTEIASDQVRQIIRFPTYKHTTWHSSGHRSFT